MEEDVALPRATLVKMIKDNLAGHELRMSSEAHDMVVDCCAEFVKMLYTQANEVCTDEKKNTIVPDHVLKAMEQLELQDWMAPLQEVLAEFKDTARPSRPKKEGTMTNEEMEDLQEQLFADARARSGIPLMPASDIMHSGQLQKPAAPPG